MIELSIFLLVQLILNLILRLVANNRVTYIFTSIATLIFGILILVYPMSSWRIYDFIYPPDPNDKIRCGNMQMGAAMFQWILGIPIVIVLQWILNKYLHKNSKYPRSA